MVRAFERPADGGHVGEALQPKHPLDQRIIPVIATLPQLTVPQQDMNDELQEDRRPSKYLPARKMSKTTAHAGLEIEDREELLRQHSPAKDVRDCFSNLSSGILRALQRMSGLLCFI